MTMQIVSELLKLTVFAGLGLAGVLVVLIWKKDLTTKIGKHLMAKISKKWFYPT